MIGAHVEEPMPGFRILTLTVEVDADGNIVEDIKIPFAAIAFRREALGIDDVAEVVETFIHTTEHGVPDVDPVTGKSHWTEAYQLLRLREQAREAAARLAREDGCHDAEVIERANQAAYDAVHQPINGGECAMDRCRREARRKLGVPDPTSKCGVETRTEPPTTPQPPARAFMAMGPAGGKAQALDILAAEQRFLHECTQAFLHGLCGDDTDPLDLNPAPESEPQPDSVILTADELLAKYQGDAA